LLLSVSAGAGHVRAAESVAAWAEGRADIAHLDVLDYVPMAFRKLYSDYYLRLVTRHPELWRAVYQATEKADPEARTQRFRRAIERLNTRKLVQAIESFAPDAILCTHFLPAEILMHEIKRARASVPVYVQVTDFDLHRMWVLPHMAGYFVANAELGSRLAAFGVRIAPAHVTGIPVMPSFDPAQAVAREEARARFGLSPERRAVLLMGGGAGMGGLAAAAAALLALPEPPAVLAVAGRSAQTFTQLQALASAHPGFLVPFGFTSEIATLMRAADLVVTKPGGLSTSECLALGVPMILTAPIPGQEEHNADFLLEEGAALKAIDTQALCFRVAALLADPSRLAAMSARAASLGRPYAARDALTIMLS
jgi:processive 1,2-diacylglycerol beta-glucosyltransferase